MRRWFWLEYNASTERGQGWDLYTGESMHATFKCRHADEKKKKNKKNPASLSYAQKAKLCKLTPPLHVYFPLEY